MNLDQKNPSYPEQEGPDKIHGDAGKTAKKEKYLRDAGKIEDFPEDDRQPDQYNERQQTANPDNDDLSNLTDLSGEEKKEDYINTDERKRDMTRKKS